MGNEITMISPVLPAISSLIAPPLSHTVFQAEDQGTHLFLLTRFLLVLQVTHPILHG
jgi:hypothetical protein